MVINRKKYILLGIFIYLIGVSIDGTTTMLMASTFPSFGVEGGAPVYEMNDHVREGWNNIGYPGILVGYAKGLLIDHWMLILIFLASLITNIHAARRGDMKVVFAGMGIILGAAHIIAGLSNLRAFLIYT